VYDRLVGGEGRGGSRDVIGSNSCYGFATGTFNPIHVVLHKRLVCSGVGEIIRAVYGTVVYKELPALDAAFVIIKKFMLGIQ